MFIVLEASLSQNTEICIKGRKKILACTDFPAFFSIFFPVGVKFGFFPAGFLTLPELTPALAVYRGKV